MLGHGGNRTYDLWNTSPTLCQLSYAVRTVLSTLEQYLIKLDSEEKESLLLGDFNCDILHNPLSALTKDVTFLLESYQYTQFINEATRITQSSKTLIDHIYSNTTHMVNSSGVLHIGILAIIV